MGAAAARCRGGISAGMEALQIKANPLLGEVVQGPQAPGSGVWDAPTPKSSEVLMRRWAVPTGPCVLTKTGKMDRGVSLENPYASVNIPRDQFQQSFITRYLKDEPTVIANPVAVSTYGMEEEADSASSWNSPTISTEKSGSRPYNPYASLRMPNGDSTNSFYTVTLDKSPKGQQQEAGGGCGCCKRCPCCRKCCCVIS